LFRLAFALWAFPSVALAGGISRVAIAGDASGCPSPAAVGQELVGMLPEVQVALTPEADALAVKLDDLGTSLRVTVGDRVRELPDAGRRCEERARQGAIVVALVLAPPQVEPPAAAARVTPSEAEVRAPIENVSAPARARRWLAFDLGALVELAPGADGGTALGEGLVIRAIFGGRRLSGLLGVAALSPSTLELPVPVRMTRLPIDLGVRTTLGSERLETVLDGGLRGQVLMLEGVGMGGDRFDLGLFAGMQERWWLKTWLAPFLALDISYSFRPYELVAGQGTVEGHTPSLWLGMTLGIATRFE
jgi:hypothetical protein